MDELKLKEANDLLNRIEQLKAFKKSLTHHDLRIKISYEFLGNSGDFSKPFFESYATKKEAEALCDDKIYLIGCIDKRIKQLENQFNKL